MCNSRRPILRKQAREIIVCPYEMGHIFFNALTCSRLETLIKTCVGVDRAVRERRWWRGISGWGCLRWMITFTIMIVHKILGNSQFQNIFFSMHPILCLYLNAHLLFCWKFCNQTSFSQGLTDGILFHLLVTPALSSLAQAWRVECIVWHLQFSMAYCFLIMVWRFSSVGLLSAAVVVLLTGETCPCHCQPPSPPFY